MTDSRSANRPHTALVSLRLPGASWMAWTEEPARRYAARHGMETVFLTEPLLSLRVLRWRRRYRNRHLEKFQLYDLLSRYDRVLYLDADVLPHPEAPLVFEEVPAGVLGVVNEQLGMEEEKRLQEWRRMRRRLGGPPQVPGRYFNAGMLVLSPAHRELFAHQGVPFAAGRWPDQNTLNHRVACRGVAVRWLEPEWNCMPVFAERFWTPSLRRKSSFIHYAGESAKGELFSDLSFFGYPVPEASRSPR